MFCPLSGKVQFSVFAQPLSSYCLRRCHLRCGLQWSGSCAVRLVLFLLLHCKLSSSSCPVRFNLHCKFPLYIFWPRIHMFCPLSSEVQSSVFTLRRGTFLVLVSCILRFLPFWLCCVWEPCLSFVVLLFRYLD